MMSSGEVCTLMVRLMYANVLEILEKLEGTRQWLDEYQPQSEEEEQLIFIYKYQLEISEKKLRKFAKYCAEKIALNATNACKVCKSIFKRYQRLQENIDVAYFLTLLKEDNDEARQASE